MDSMDSEKVYASQTSEKMWDLLAVLLPDEIDIERSPFLRSIFPPGKGPPTQCSKERKK